MWAEALKMLDEANRLQRRFFEVSVRPLAAPQWEPPVDIFESDDELWFFYALPGVAIEQVQVGMNGGELVVPAARAPGGPPRPVRAAHPAARGAVRADHAAGRPGVPGDRPAADRLR
jgi:hypothetical protein